MPETCWDSVDNKHLIVASCWFSLSSHFAHDARSQEPKGCLICFIASSWQCVLHWALFGLIVLPYVTYSLGGWERKEALQVSTAPPTIELHGMENFKVGGWPGFLTVSRGVITSTEYPTNHITEDASCRERFAATALGEWSTSHPERNPGTHWTEGWVPPVWTFYRREQPRGPARLTNCGSSSPVVPNLLSLAYHLAAYFHKLYPSY